MDFDGLEISNSESVDLRRGRDVKWRFLRVCDVVERCGSNREEAGYLWFDLEKVTVEVGRRRFQLVILREGKER